MSSDLQTQLNNVKPEQQSDYDKILEQILDGKDTVLVTGSLALPGTVGDGKAKITLPDLPKGVKWQMSPITGDLRAKMATTGTAGNTVVQVAKEEDPDTNLATGTIANTDGDDTYINMASVSRELLPGGQVLLLHVDALPTAGAGPISVEMVFRPVADRQSTQVVDLQ